MASLTFILRDGTQRTVQRQSGTVMEAARNAGIAGIIGECGGACACGTCHIYLCAPGLAVNRRAVKPDGPPGLPDWSRPLVAHPATRFAHATRVRGDRLGQSFARSRQFAHSLDPEAFTDHHLPIKCRVYQDLLRPKAARHTSSSN